MDTIEGLSAHAGRMENSVRRKPPTQKQLAAPPGHFVEAP